MRPASFSGRPARLPRTATGRHLLPKLKAWGARMRPSAPAQRFLLVLLLACASCEAMGQSDVSPRNGVSLEYAVKATYLYKLAPFVNWPPQEFASPSAPFHICVVGQNPFGEFLTTAVAGRRYGTHPFQVRTLETLGPDEDCQIAFIGHQKAEKVHEALAAVSGQPVLTVTDAAAMDQAIVQFVIDRGRVRFQIDTGAAARNHITISSKLLNLAMAVRNSS
jgi:hypothetical protein